VSDCLFSLVSWGDQVAFRCDGDSVRFALHQNVFHSTSSFKRQFANRYVSPLGHIILIPCQTVFAITHGYL